MVILPGRTEYIEKYGLVISDLAKAGWGALVIDWRGQGMSDRFLPDARMGHVSHFADYQRDLDVILTAADELAPGPKPWLVHSMGGCIGFRGLLHGKRPSAVSFSAPMLGLSQSDLLTKALHLLSFALRPLDRGKTYAPTTGPDFGLPGMNFDENNLTTDRKQFDRMKAQINDTPELALGGPSLRWTCEAIREMSALARQPAPDVAALFGLGSDEAIVSPKAIRDRVAAWASASLSEFSDAKHELMMERSEIRDEFLRQTLSLFDANTR